MRPIVKALRARAAITGLVLLLLAAAGCSSSSSTSSGSTSSTTTPGTGTSASPSAGGSTSSTGIPLGAPLSVAQQASILAKYTGGKVGVATGSPIEIGWVNTDTGLSAFPLQTTSAKAAVQFVNDHLDGINGHVIKLVTCSIASEEDGQSCGSQFLNDPSLHAVIEGILIAGADTFFKTINNTKAVIQLSANSAADLNPYSGNNRPNVFTLSAGAVGTYSAMITYAAKYDHTKKMLLIGEDDPAVRTGFTSFAAQLTADGVQSKSVFITPGAGASQVAADLQGAGASSDDGWFISSDEETCSNIFQYAQQAGAPSLIMGQECNGALFKSEDGSYAPKGLIFADLGWNVFLPQESTLQNAINYAMVAGVPSGNDPYSEAIAYYNVLNTVRAMNAAGSGLSTQGIATAIRNLKTPILGNLGNYDCGGVAGFPTICGNAVGLVKYTGTGYVRISPTSSVPLLKVWQFQS
jgi:ABC-type branched-subunit amino acid transport system substrate-binding protein